eukprot:CAMPEP_0114498768 /NCGR_PEP_ID=MMETSP0109-20121206/7052_1 /TAXON_ID=29199 /ORGANISM="Chlorarachnion reptans, Strain CCCM449" /LENGTH=325 /DNA_ID=CAMNT_0001676275 /DNA_START=52 /DNA_END=1029 /DNA_ORIENTATION=+
MGMATPTPARSASSSSSSPAAATPGGQPRLMVPGDRGGIAEATPTPWWESNSVAKDELWSQCWADAVAEGLRKRKFPSSVATKVVRYAAPCWGYSNEAKSFVQGRALGVAAKVNESREDSIFLAQPFSSGCWEVHLRVDALGDPADDSSDSDTEMWTHVGLVYGGPENHKAEEGSLVVGWTDASISLFQSGQIYWNRHPVIPEGMLGYLKYTRGDTIVVRMDLEKYLLQFGVNERRGNLISIKELTVGRRARAIIPLNKCGSPSSTGAMPMPMYLGVTMQERGQTCMITSIYRYRQVRHSILNGAAQVSDDKCDPMRSMGRKRKI